MAKDALTSALDRHRLLTVPHEEALATLRAIKGIGPFWAEGILAGATDPLTLGEKRGRVDAAEAYETPEVGRRRWSVCRPGERWRPFRTWVAVLLRATA